MVDVSLSGSHRPAGVSQEDIEHADPSRQTHDRSADTGGFSNQAKELSPKRRKLLACARSLFARLVHSTSSLANDLARRDRNYSLPCSLGLVWQGMLSIARPAGMDEMFGAYNKAVRGYAQAANLVWLLSLRVDSPSKCVLDQFLSSHSNSARASLPAVPEHSTSIECAPSVSSSVSADEQCFMQHRDCPCPVFNHGNSSHGSHADEDAGDSGHHRTLVHAQDVHEKAAPAAKACLLDWNLTEEQETLLHRYIGHLYQRHEACLHHPNMPC